MTIVGLSVVKNEEDIIEAMVRHNLGFVDRLHIVDNASDDLTPEILGSLIKEGLPVTTEIDNSNTHQQANILTELTNGRFANNDLVLLDADEFIGGSKRELTAMFGARGTLYDLPWVTYVPRTTDDSSEINPVRRIIHRRKRELPRFRKATVPAWLPRPLQVSSGSHKLVGHQSVAHPQLFLAHFPVRSGPQIAVKALTGSWRMRLRKRTPDEGYHWAEIAEDIRQNGLPDPARLEGIANGYAAKRLVSLVNDPLMTGGHNLKYTPKAADRLLQNICCFVDQIFQNMHKDE